MATKFLNSFFLLITQILIFHTVKSQSIVDGNDKNIANKLAIKTTLTAPLEINSGLNLGVEYSLNSKIGFQSGFNIIKTFFTENQESSERYNVRGFRFRNEIRLYSYEVLSNQNMYAAFEVSLNKISFEKYRTLQFFDPLSQRDYYQYKLIGETRRGQTFNVKMGYVYRFNRSIYIDIFGGLGVQNVNRITYDLPENFVKVYINNKVDRLQEKRFIPNAQLGWAIGYRIK